MLTYKSGRCFQISFIFTPIWGRSTHFDQHIFSEGLKPPTRNMYIYIRILIPLSSGTSPPPPGITNPLDLQILDPWHPFDPQVTFDEFYKMMTTPAPPMSAFHAFGWFGWFGFDEILLRVHFLRKNTLYALFVNTLLLSCLGKYTPVMKQTRSNKKFGFPDRMCNYSSWRNYSQRC